MQLETCHGSTDSLHSLPSEFQIVTMATTTITITSHFDQKPKVKWVRFYSRADDINFDQKLIKDTKKYKS